MFNCLSNRWYNLFALSVAVGITPSMLPMIVNVNLTKGSKNLAKKKVLVKRIEAIQNLGAMDILCTDKTGILKENKIVLQKYIDVLGNENLNVLEYAYLNSYYSTGMKNIVDRAILIYGSKHNLDNILPKYNKIDEIPKTSEIGTIEEDTTLINDYISYLISKKENDFSNLKIALDCANGSSSKTASKIFESFNCKTFIINDKYNGTNINDNAGSTHVDILKDYVIKNKCDAGFSFDGDADRCIAIDNEGNIIDGDYVLAIIGMYLKEKGKLRNNSIVGTIMSNLGLIKFCKDNNINFVSTKVGDRYVLEEMLVNNYSIGGEQSGHTIFMDYANTGEGELTAIMILNVITGTNKSLNELSKIMKKYPQALINIPV